MVVGVNENAKEGVKDENGLFVESAERRTKELNELAKNDKLDVMRSVV